MCDCTNAEKVPKVEIDESGDFRYILIKVQDYFKKEANIVRGGHKKHVDIHNAATRHLKHVTCETLGGGRITFDPEAKKIRIYGSSKVYGTADHKVTLALLKDAYPEFKIVIGDEEAEESD